MIGKVLANNLIYLLFSFAEEILFALILVQGTFALGLDPERKILTVLKPDSTPAAKAHVSVYTESTNRFYVERGREHRNDYYSTNTNSEGKCEIPMLVENFGVYISHPHGYKMISRNELVDVDALSLQTWVVIEGVYTKNNRPASGEIISLSSNELEQSIFPNIFFYDITNTNSDGYYRFANTVGGKIQISTMVPIDKHSSKVDLNEIRNVRPGDKIRVDFNKNESLLWQFIPGLLMVIGFFMFFSFLFYGLLFIETPQKKETANED